MMSFMDFLSLQVLDQVLVARGGTEIDILQEGKWINGRFDRNIRIDQPTHGVGQAHAHVLGRKGDQLGVVNFDGSSSHGTKMRLDKKDADALRNAGVAVRSDNIVEWIVLTDQPEILFG
jgi:hypothetical protein